MQTHEVSKTYRNYVLIMLTFVYVFNFVDRQLIVILQELIKKELNLSDTQLGMLSGLRSRYSMFIQRKPFKNNPKHSSAMVH
jgi:hypothetical protein